MKTFTSERKYITAVISMFEDQFFISGHKLKNICFGNLSLCHLSHSLHFKRVKAMRGDWSDLRNYITTLHGTISTNSAAAGGF